METFFDTDLIKEIVNRIISLVLRETLNLKSPDTDAQFLEYCPSWKWSTEEKSKELRGLLVSRAGNEKFSFVSSSDITVMGLFPSEVLEYLEKSDATRVKVTSI